MGGSTVKKRLRVLSIICAVTMMLSMFAGCGKNNSATTQGTDKQDAPKTIPTLVWWQIGTQPKNLADGVAKINDYISGKYGFKIDIKVAGWDAYETKMNTIVNTGEAFDIMFVNNNNYNRFINVGAFEDISDSVKKEAPDLFKFIPEKVWNGTKYNGKIYAVPTYKDSSITQYFVWDDSIVKKYNIDYANIKTLKDLDKPFRAMKAAEGKTYYPLYLIKSDGFSGMFNQYDDLTLGFNPIGVKIDDQSRKVVSVLEQPDIMDTLKQLHVWYKDGIINPDAPTLGEAPKKLPFFSAQAFPGAEASYQVNNGVEKYVMTQQFGPFYTTSSIQGSLNAISKNSKYKKEALKFLQAVNTDSQLRNMLAYGVEGTDWQKVSDNVIKRTSDTWTLPAYSQGTFFNMAVVSPNPANQWDAVKKLNEQAKASATLGYALDISKLSTEVANCRAVWDKYKEELKCGASDPEKMVPQIVSELKAAGMDTIMKEAQKQINEFFK